MNSRIFYFTLLFALVTGRASRVLGSGGHSKTEKWWREVVGGCTYVAYLPDGKQAVAEYQSGGPRLLNVTNHVSFAQKFPIANPGGGHLFFGDAALSPDGLYFAAIVSAVSHGAGKLFLWRVGPKCRLLWRASKVEIDGTRVAFSPNSKLVVAGRYIIGKGWRIGMQLWSARGGKVRAQAQWFPGIIAHHFPGPLALSFLGNRRVAASLDHRLLIWGYRPGRPGMGELRLITCRWYPLVISMQSLQRGRRLAILHPFYSHGDPNSNNLGKAADPPGTGDLAILRVPSGDRSRVLTWRMGLGLRKAISQITMGDYLQLAPVEAPMIVTPNDRFAIVTQLAHDGNWKRFGSNFLVIRLSDGRIIYRSPVVKGWVHTLSFSPLRRSLLFGDYRGVHMFGLPMRVWDKLRAKNRK